VRDRERKRENSFNPNIPHRIYVKMKGTRAVRLKQKTARKKTGNGTDRNEDKRQSTRCEPKGLRRIILKEYCALYLAADTITT
jgi:hypothetical protein